MIYLVSPVGTMRHHSLKTSLDYMHVIWLIWRFSAFSSDTKCISKIALRKENWGEVSRGRLPGYAVVCFLIKRKENGRALADMVRRWWMMRARSSQNAIDHIWHLMMVEKGKLMSCRGFHRWSKSRPMPPNPDKNTWDFARSFCMWFTEEQ